MQVPKIQFFMVVFYSISKKNHGGNPFWAQKRHSGILAHNKIAGSWGGFTVVEYPMNILMCILSCKLQDKSYYQCHVIVWLKKLRPRRYLCWKYCFQIRTHNSYPDLQKALQSRTEYLSKKVLFLAKRYQKTKKKSMFTKI